MKLYGYSEHRGGMQLTLGERLKAKRIEKGLSLRELAQIAHISHSFLADIEAGRSAPSVDTLKSIARALNASVSTLLEEDGAVDDPTPPGRPGVEREALSRSDDPMDDLPEEARKSIEEFKQFIIEKYRRKKS